MILQKPGLDAGSRHHGSEKFLQLVTGGAASWGVDWSNLNDNFTDDNSAVRNYINLD
jgi:hypothetical protein